MKIFTITLSIAILTLTATSFAQTEPLISPLLLVEVQLGSSTSAMEEFVELANTSGAPVDLTGNVLQYKSKSGTSWSTKADLTGWIAPYGRYVVSNYLSESSQDFGGGLAGTSGHLRLANSDNETIDLIGWGDAIEPETLTTPTHGSSQTLKRLVDEDGRFIDTDNNLDDWFVSDTPSPSFDVWIVEEVIEEGPVESEEPEPELEVDPEPVIAQPVQSLPLAPEVAKTHPLNITELMPDPTSPLRDSDHEFVEIFNPNKFAVNLAGYILESGTNWRYSFELGVYELQPSEYLAIYSQDSNLTLSNSGTGVRLLGLDGSELDFVEYEKSKPGLSWSLSAGGWAWTDPTPNAKDLRYETVISVVGAEDTDDADVLGTLEQRDITFPPNADASSETSANKASTFVEEVDEPTRVNNSILAGVGLIALLYAIYEYRNEIRIRVERIRRYAETRREDRPESDRRRSDRATQRYRRWQDNISTWYRQRRGQRG